MKKKVVKKKKLKIIPFFIALLIIVLVSFSVIQILQAKIKNIIITNGDYLKDDYIIDLAGIRDYPSFYLTNTLKIKKNLLKSPYIRNVKIKREFYHVLEIEVVTNRPLFINSATNEVVFEDKNTVKVDDEIDLFKPSYVDEHNKYRYYSIDQFECLETIQYLKELGLTLNKIKYHLNTLNLSSIVDSLEYQKHIIDEKISELRQMKEKVDKKIIQIQDATQLDFLEQIRELEFEQRCAIEYKEDISYKGVELLVRKLAQVSEYKVFLTYGDVGISIFKHNLEKKVYTQYNSAFAIVEEGQYEKNLIKVFPKAKYLSIRYNGYHKDAPKYYEKLDKYISENNYEIIDDSIEIQLVDPSLITCKSEMVSEIQIPVRRRLYD